MKTPSDIFRRYEKVGNEDSALEDFYSVDPSYVKFDFGSLRNGVCIHNTLMYHFQENEWHESILFIKNVVEKLLT